MPRKSKVETLKENGDIPGLLQIMDNHPDWLVRMDAAEALAQLGDKLGFDSLLESYQSGDQEERCGFKKYHLRR